MMYIQGSAIDKKFTGSLEHQALVVKGAIAEHFGDSPVRVLATHPGHAYAVDGDGQVLKIKYTVEGGEVTGVTAKPTKEIPVIEDENIPCFVAGGLKSIVESMVSGKKVPRTQVREVTQLLSRDEIYWVSDIIGQIDEAIESSVWFNMYEANQEKVRTAMYGNIREIEALFSTTKFAKIASSKVYKFEKELREALTLVTSLVTEMVDECSQMVFDQDRDEFFRAICESLKVEAQAIGGLLSKAEKLMRTEDVGRMAEAHDRLAERAKTMAVVTAYIKTRSQHNNSEE